MAGLEQRLLWRADPTQSGELRPMETRDDMRAAAKELARLRASLAIADAACRSYWGWEYGPPGENDSPDASLLVEWRKDRLAHPR